MILGRTAINLHYEALRIQMLSNIKDKSDDLDFNHRIGICPRQCQIPL